MTRPLPTKIFHFTRLEHLSTIVQHGLVSDVLAKNGGLTQVEVGQQSIKRRRAEALVPCGSYGCVADYVPFYYAPRSPMMHNIHTGKVASYQEGCDRLVYLSTTTQTLMKAELPWVASDRNAALQHAEFTTQDERLEEMTAWDVMTIEPCLPHEDRIERRMAEFLVYNCVPFESVLEVGVQSDTIRVEADAILAQSGATLQSLVRPHWYF